MYVDETKKQNVNNKNILLIQMLVSISFQSELSNKI